MFRSLFGGKKKRDSDKPAPDETIRSAQVGDVVVINGFSPTLEDAYFIIENVNRFEAPFGKWFELMGVDGERRVAIEWSDNDGLYIAVNEQDGPMGLAVIGIDEDALVQLDEQHSIDNSVTYEGEDYFYRNSYEAHYYKDNQGGGEGFYLWEFGTENGEKTAAVVKWEGMPFEVYASVVVAPEIVSLYKK